MPENGMTQQIGKIHGRISNQSSVLISLPKENICMRDGDLSDLFLTRQM